MSNAADLIASDVVAKPIRLVFIVHRHLRRQE